MGLRVRVFKLLKGVVILRIIQGSIIGPSTRDTRSLNYSSHELLSTLGVLWDH